MSKRITGRVKYFKSSAGFGFITPDDKSGDIFVNQTAIPKNAQGKRELRVGQKVSFIVKHSPDSRYATSVRTS